jgi:glucokinase
VTGEALHERDTRDARDARDGRAAADARDARDGRDARDARADRNGSALLVGVDIGGSKIAVLVTDAELSVRSRYTEPTTVGSPDRAARAIAQAVDTALAESGDRRADVGSVGVGVPGRVDPAAGTVTQAVNLGWHDLALAPQLSRELGIPVAIENDVRAAAAGIRERRLLGDVENFAYLSVGTGISAGIVLDGNVRRGPHGMAGEIGHIVFEANGPECVCGMRGCLEALAGGPAIARRAAGALAAGEDSMLRGLTTLGAAEVYAAATSGDKVARDVVDDVGLLIARAIHLLVLAYDVNVVALGGGVTRAGDAFLEPVQRGLDSLRHSSTLARELLPDGVVRLLPPADIGAWGAAVLARSALADGHDGTSEKRGDARR